MDQIPHKQNKKWGFDLLAQLLPCESFLTRQSARVLKLFAFVESYLPRVKVYFNKKAPRGRANLN